MKKKFYSLISYTAICALLLSGCGSTVPDTEIIVDSGEQTVSYTFVTATYDDVVLTKELNAISVQAKDQEVSFSMTGKYIDKVYVRKGDSVKKGDILAELSSGSLEKDIKNLEYNIARNELLLEYSYTNEELDIQDRWLPTISNPSMSTDGITEAVKGIKENYARQRVLLNDSLEFDKKELEKKKKEFAASRVYANMDGTVLKITDYLEGSTSKADEVIMTIIDDSEMLFRVDGVEDAGLFHEGDLIDMQVGYSTSNIFIITPYKMDEWKDEIRFSVVSAPEDAEVKVGEYGYITIPLEKKENVLSIPKSVVRTAGDKSYVYTVSSEGVREIRYIETGLIGDERVEIISGLSEGEKVVKK